MVKWYNFKVMRFVLPAKKQPKVFNAFKAGYNTLSSHLYLLLFPILLDVFFLFGKRLLIADQIRAMFTNLTLPSSVSTEMLNSWEELSNIAVEMFKNFSLTAFLRSFPIGVPSLLAYRPMESNPLGDFSSAQIASFGSTIIYALGFSLIGFLLGILFLRLIRNSILNNSSAPTSDRLPQQLLSLFTIPVFVIFLSMFVLVPIIFLISIFNSFLPFLGTLGYFLLSLGIISSVIPMFFTPHEILLSGSNFVNSAKESVRNVRPTNGKTSIFIMLAYLATYATNLLWQIPKDDSWMLAVSILGHALVTTIIFIASFHFYIDARDCVRDSLISKTPINEDLGV